MPEPISLEQLNALDPGAFVEAIGFAFEESPWIARRAWEQRPFASRDALIDALCEVVARATLAEQLALIDAHPDLAGKAMETGQLTPSSDGEQRLVGLDRLTSAQRARLLAGAQAYRERFGFSCIVCVRDHRTADAIVYEVERRVDGSAGAELDASVREVFAIARHRLEDVIAEDPAPTTGYLTSHVLDTARGLPGAGMEIELLRWELGSWRHLATTTTNADGRTDAPLLEEGALRRGRYELRFHVGRYFADAGVAAADPPYLGVVPVRIAVANEDEHFHVPLIVAPWGYSTYRGS